ncbi:MAG TPA: major capsid protein [Verrucomicrobiae bacterium]
MVSNASLNVVLTAMAVKFMQESKNFTGLRLFPLFLTGEQSAGYYVMDEENLLNVPRNIQRAPRSAYSRGLMKISSDTYNCREFGHEEPVDDRERKKYARSFDADASAMRRAMNVLMVNHEVRVKAKATGASVPTSSPSTKWDSANSDPIADIETARASIHKNTGMEANTMVVSRDVFNILKEHDIVAEKIKYSERAIITPDLLAAVFGVEQFLVAGTIENTAQEGQAATPNYIWGDSVVLAHVQDTPDLMAPNFGRTFGWVGEVGQEGVVVESYRQDVIRSDVHRARQDVDEKIIGAKAGYHLSNVLTT